MANTVSNPFRYAGQYLDSESGLYYLRARYYDPATAQFLTVDPLLAVTGQAYNYAAGSPTNATDPSGESIGPPTKPQPEPDVYPSAICQLFGWCVSNAERAGRDFLANGGVFHRVLGGTVSVVGDFAAIDWTGYPGDVWGVERPTGPFQLRTGSDYIEARNAADAANQAIRRGAECDLPGGLDGLHIHEIHPIKFGGSPSDVWNKIALPRNIHAEFTSWWLRIQRALER